MVTSCIIVSLLIMEYNKLSYGTHALELWRYFYSEKGCRSSHASAIDILRKYLFVQIMTLLCLILFMYIQ